MKGHLTTLRHDPNTDTNSNTVTDRDEWVEKHSIQPWIPRFNPAVDRHLPPDSGHGRPALVKPRGKSATGQDSRENFADDQGTVWSLRASGPLVTGALAKMANADMGVRAVM